MPGHDLARKSTASGRRFNCHLGQRTQQQINQCHLFFFHYKNLLAFHSGTEWCDGESMGIYFLMERRTNGKKRKQRKREQEK